MASILQIATSHADMEIFSPPTPAIAVDLGAGKIRCVYSFPDGNGGWFTKKLSSACNWGQGMSPKQDKPVIIEANFLCGLDFLERVGNFCEAYRIPPKNRVAIATESLRLIESKNPGLAEIYKDRIENKLGFRPFIATGEEEARLDCHTAYLDCLDHNLAFEKLAVSTFGGGSSQQGIVYSDGRMYNAVSRPMGKHTLAVLSEGDLRDAEKIYREDLKRDFDVSGIEISWVGGGNWRAMTEVVCTPESNTILGATEIRRAMSKLKKMEVADFRLCGDHTFDRAENLPIASRALSGWVKHISPSILIFGKRTSSETVVKIIQRQASGTKEPVPPGLERLFYPEAPLQLLRA